MTTNRRHSLTQHAISASVAILLLTYGHKALHVAGDGYAFAWTAFGIAWTLQHRRKGMIWLALAWITLLAAISDLPVLRDSLTYLTGAAW